MKTTALSVRPRNVCSILQMLRYHMLQISYFFIMCAMDGEGQRRVENDKFR